MVYIGITIEQIKIMNKRDDHRDIVNPKRDEITIYKDIKEMTTDPKSMIDSYKGDQFI